MRLKVDDISDDEWNAGVAVRCARAMLDRYGRPCDRDELTLAQQRMIYACGTRDRALAVLASLGYILDDPRESVARDLHPAGSAHPPVEPWEPLDAPAGPWLMAAVWASVTLAGLALWVGLFDWLLR